MKRILGLFIGMLLLVACSQKYEISQPKSDIGFEIKNFTITTEDKSNEEIPQINWTGKGIVRVVGNPEALKENYVVFVKCEKIKGGDLNDKDKGTKLVLVEEGIGEIGTYDYIYTKLAQQKTFEPPEYKFEIYGYIPIKSFKKPKEEINKK